MLFSVLKLSRCDTSGLMCRHRNLTACAWILSIAMALGHPAWAQAQNLLPGEMSIPSSPSGRQLVWPDQLPTVENILEAVADPEVRPLAMFRFHGDENNHYAPAWSKDGQAISFLRSDLSAHTSKTLVIDLALDQAPRVLYEDFLSYEHMNCWSHGSQRLLAFSSNNEDQRHENIHITSERGSDCRAVTTGSGLKTFPSLISNDETVRLLYRRGAEVLEASFQAKDWSENNETSLGQAEEAVFSPDGTRIAIVRPTGELREGHELHVRNPDTRRETSVYAEKDHIIRNPTFSPDGKQLAFFSRSQTEIDWGLWVLSTSGQSTPRLLATNIRVEEDFRQVGPAWGALSNKLWYFNNVGTQGYHPIQWISVDGKLRGQIDYPTRFTTAMDLASSSDTSVPALAFVAVQQHALDVFVVLLNHH